MRSEIDYHGIVVGFDLDDTIFRERDFCRSGFRFLLNPELYKVQGVADYPDEASLETLYHKMESALTRRDNPFTEFENFFRPLVESAGEVWDLDEHILAYRNHLPSITPEQEVIETMDFLSRRGVRMALITDGRSNTQRRKIEALGLEKYVAPDLILISEETGSDKHSKEMFATLVRRFPEASGFYYVGDNVAKDFHQPNLLGWTTIQVPTHPDNVHPAVEPESPLHAPSRKLNSLPDLLEFFQREVGPV